MFRVKKTFEIAVAHKLSLPYVSKCTNIHGHNLIITVYCQGERDENGMVTDFTLIKKIVQDKLDHQNLNEIEGLGFTTSEEDENLAITENPTAENIAKWISVQVPNCYQVDVQESEGNVATYIDDRVIG